MATMTAVRIHRFGGPEVMELDEVPIPEPQEDELLVEVRAASINPVDYKTREGKYPPVGEDKLPMTLGRDVSGIVRQCGSRAQVFQSGDPVYAMVGNDRGTFAEHVVVKANQAAAKPARLSHVEAAAVPLAALTAWQGLFDHGGLRRGQHVLIHGGAGGVGHFAIQFARHIGAEVSVTASAEDLTFVRELGADTAIDYASQRFEDLVHEVDLVFDLVAGETQNRSWPVIKPGGALVSTLGPPPEDKARMHQVRSTGYMVQPNGLQLVEIGRLIDAGTVRPVVLLTYPFRAASQAEQRHQEGHVHGKIVLEIAA